MLAHANLMKFNKAKCKVLHESQGNPKHRLGRECPGEKMWGVGGQKAQHELSMCTHSPESQTCPGQHCKDKDLLEQVKRRT